jgi:hypothetical protein
VTTWGLRGGVIDAERCSGQQPGRQARQRQVHVPNAGLLTSSIESIIFSTCPTSVRKPRHPCSPKPDQEPWRKLSSKLCQMRRRFSLAGAPVSVGQAAAEPCGNGRPDMFSVPGTYTPSVCRYICDYNEALRWTDEYTKALTLE